LHELSLCDDLLSQVIAIAAQHQTQSVESITVNIGELSGIEPSLLDTAFSLLKVGTIAEASKLIIRQSPVIVFCPHCNAKAEVVANHLLCPVCLSTDTHLMSGDEMILESVALCIA